MRAAGRSSTSPNPDCFGASTSSVVSTFRTGVEDRRGRRWPAETGGANRQSAVLNVRVEIYDLWEADERETAWDRLRDLVPMIAFQIPTIEHYNATV
jgi:hypothetical protein